MGDDDGGPTRDAKRTLVEAFSAFGDDALRDAWLFDQHAYEGLYLREDVEEKVADLDVPRFVDNERYGYVTRDIYSDLYYASYEYTVRGFDDFEQFRTFLLGEDRRVGLFASFDRREGGYDFGALSERLSTVAGEYAVEAFAPE